MIKKDKRQKRFFY